MNRINFIPLYKLFFGCITLAMLGCNNKDEPFIQELDNENNEKNRFLTIVDYQVTGTRDGDVSKANYNFIVENGEKIQLYLEVFYNPTPTLRSGFWSLTGSKACSGYVRSKSLKFLGGQGEAPSLGGRFELLEKSHPRFFVSIPLRPIKEISW